MDARAETITIPDNKPEASVAARLWLRVTKYVGIPYVRVGALGLVAVAASLAWFVAGGSWWLPLCIFVSAVSSMEVCWAVYEGWKQHKAMHEWYRSAREALKEGKASPPR